MKRSAPRGQKCLRRYAIAQRLRAYDTREGNKNTLLYSRRAYHGRVSRSRKTRVRNSFDLSLTHKAPRRFMVPLMRWWSGSQLIFLSPTKCKMNCSLLANLVSQSGPLGTLLSRKRGVTGFVRSAAFGASPKKAARHISAMNRLMQSSLNGCEFFRSRGAQRRSRPSLPSSKRLKQAELRRTIIEPTQ